MKPSMLTLLTVLLAGPCFAGDDVCPLCRGTKMIQCPDCQVRGVATGLTECKTCGGKGRVRCPTCHGTCRKCPYCKGTGKLPDGTKSTDRIVRKDYKECHHCEGTGWLYHRDNGLKVCGPCPTCKPDRSPRRMWGTIPCPTCKGQRRSGVCPTCKGTKRIPCPRCAKEAKRIQTVVPVTMDFTNPVAAEAMKAYAQRVLKTREAYDKELKALQARRDKALAAAREEVLASLAKAMQAATKAGDLDEAIKIRAASRAIAKGESDPKAAPAPKPAATGAPPHGFTTTPKAPTHRTSPASGGFGSGRSGTKRKAPSPW